jgi:hypothetical protein
MAAPFLAEYASVFHKPQDLARIAGDLARWNADPPRLAVPDRCRFVEAAFRGHHETQRNPGLRD